MEFSDPREPFALDDESRETALRLGRSLLVSIRELCVMPPAADALAATLACLLWPSVDDEQEMIHRAATLVEIAKEALRPVPLDPLDELVGIGREILHLAFRLRRRPLLTRHGLTIAIGGMVPTATFGECHRASCVVLGLWHPDDNDQVRHLVSQ